MTKRAHGWMRNAGLVIVALMWAATPAAAQTSLQVLGGATNADRTNALAGVAIVTAAGPIELGLEGGRLFDIIPAGVASASRSLSGGTVSARLPVWYGLGNARVLLPLGPVQPFVSVGAGVARLEPEVTFVSPSITATVIFGDAEARTKFLTALGAGARISLGLAHVEGGYRYLRVFQHYRPDTNFNNDDVLVSAHVVYVAVGIRF